MRVSRSNSPVRSPALRNTFWEGDRQVDVLLRLDPDQRRGFDDVRTHTDFRR